MTETIDPAARPSALDSFVGQDHFKTNLKVFIASAKAQKKAMDHVILFGPPGLGKTTLAQIIANELGAKMHTTMGPRLQKIADIIKVLGEIREREVLFIDEIHRLPQITAEVLYPVMEDFAIDLQFGKKMVRGVMSPFTLIGATTKAGTISQPMRDRFGIQLKLQLYSTDEIAGVVRHGAMKLGYRIDDPGATQIACRSRGTPRIALNLLKRVHDFAIVQGGTIDAAMADETLLSLGIDKRGLTEEDHRYIRVLAEQFGGGPAGLEAIAMAMGEDKDSVEDLIEPYLLQACIVKRTSKGRMLAPEYLTKFLPGFSIREACENAV